MFFRILTGRTGVRPLQGQRMPLGPVSKHESLTQNQGANSVPPYK